VRCIDILPIEVEIHAGSLEMLDGAEQIDQGSTHAIDGPPHSGQPRHVTTLRNGLLFPDHLGNQTPVIARVFFYA
jgi:hypothetical protein